MTLLYFESQGCLLITFIWQISAVTVSYGLTWEGSGPPVWAWGVSWAQIWAGRRGTWAPWLGSPRCARCRCLLVSDRRHRPRPLRTASRPHTPRRPLRLLTTTRMYSLKPTVAAYVWKILLIFIKKINLSLKKKNNKIKNENIPLTTASDSNLRIRVLGIKDYLGSVLEDSVNPKIWEVNPGTFSTVVTS